MAKNVRWNHEKSQAFLGTKNNIGHISEVSFVWAGILKSDTDKYHMLIILCLFSFFGDKYVTQNIKFAINLLGHLLVLILWDCARLYFWFCGTINIGACAMADLQCVLICLCNNDTSGFFVNLSFIFIFARLICCAWLLRHVILGAWNVLTKTRNIIKKWQK